MPCTCTFYAFNILVLVYLYYVLCMSCEIVCTITWGGVSFFALEEDNELFSILFYSSFKYRKKQSLYL